MGFLESDNKFLTGIVSQIKQIKSKDHIYLRKVFLGKPQGKGVGAKSHGQSKAADLNYPAGTEQ